VVCKLDKVNRIGNLVCKVCGQTHQCVINSTPPSRPSRCMFFVVFVVVVGVGGIRGGPGTPLSASLVGMSWVWRWMSLTHGL
jgi:hypothetical protein